MKFIIDKLILTATHIEMACLLIHRKCTKIHLTGKYGGNSERK